MGMFDSVSNAAGAAGAPLSTLSNMLGGNMGDGAANDALTGKPEWWRGHNLDVDKAAEESAGQAANLQNALNTYPVIEFIHFGWVHTSHLNFFEHKELSGTNKDAGGNKKIKDGDRKRGIQFRSALEREALLLWLFMKSTQEVLKQKEDDSKLGGLGAALDVASSMFGGNKPSGGQTQSSELTNYMAKVTTAINPILNKNIVYKDIHKAGVDLNQARYDYRALLDKIISEKPAAGDGGIAGTLMNQATSLPGKIMGGGDDDSSKGGDDGKDGKNSAAGTLGSIVSLTQGILFKAQDVTAKLYAYTARQQEQQIEAASNEMTYQGIHQTMNPFFPVWFTPAAPPPPPPDQWGGPDDPLNQAGGNLLDFAKKPIQGKDNEERSKIQGEGNQLKGFFEKAPDGPPPPGTESVGMAFDDPPQHRGEKSLVPMTMGAVACQAFSKVLDLHNLGFAETVVGGIMGVVLEFTMATYQTLLVRDATKEITEDDMAESAAKDLKLANRLKDIATSKLTFLQKAKDWDVKKYTDHVPLANNFSLKPAGLMDKGADDLDKLIEEKITPLLEPIVHYAMKSLATTLNDVRAVGTKDKCHTMEWYLGRLPMVQAQLFSNLFFPFWTAMMKAGADLIGGPVGSALKSILAVADKMKKVVDDVRDDAAKVKGYSDAANQALKGPQELGTGGMNKETHDTIQAFRDAGKKKGDDNTKSTQPETPGQQDLAKNHPLKSRVDAGLGQKIAKADYDQMHDATNPKIFKWDDATDPSPSVDNKKDTAAAGSSAGAPAGGGGAK